MSLSASKIEEPTVPMVVFTDARLYWGTAPLNPGGLADTARDAVARHAGDHDLYNFIEKLNTGAGPHEGVISAYDMVHGRKIGEVIVRDVDEDGEEAKITPYTVYYSADGMLSGLYGSAFSITATGKDIDVKIFAHGIAGRIEAADYLTWTDAYDVHAYMDNLALMIAAGEVEYGEIRHYVYGVADRENRIKFVDFDGIAGRYAEELLRLLDEKEGLEINLSGDDKADYIIFRAPNDFRRDKIAIGEPNVQRLQYVTVSPKFAAV